MRAQIALHPPNERRAVTVTFRHLRHVTGHAAQVAADVT